MGASDFVSYDVDHKLIADIVNRAHPGWGKSAVLPGSDHLFHDFGSESESMKNFQKGKFNPAFIKMTKDWIHAVIASRDSRARGCTKNLIYDFRASSKAKASSLSSPANNSSIVYSMG